MALASQPPGGGRGVLEFHVVHRGPLRPALEGQLGCLGSRLTLCSRTPRKGTVGSELRNSNPRIPRRSLELRGPSRLGL